MPSVLLVSIGNEYNPLVFPRSATLCSTICSVSHLYPSLTLFGMNTITLLFRYSSRRYSVGMEGRAYKSNCGKRALTAPTVLVDRLLFLDAVSLQWPISINGTPLERSGAPHHSSHFSLSTSCPPRLVPPSIFCVSRAPRMGYSFNMPPYNPCHPNRDHKPRVHRLRISTKTDHVWYTRRPSVI